MLRGVRPREETEGEGWGGGSHMKCTSHLLALHFTCLRAEIREHRNPSSQELKQQSFRMLSWPLARLDRPWGSLTALGPRV